MDGIHTQQQLVEQKNKVVESINLHERLVSPLWRLPTEILSQIFYHCLPQIPEPHQFQAPSKLTAPMLLTRICRRWREVAVGMPNLWCVLSVEVDDRNWQQPYINQISSLSVEFFHRNTHELNMFRELLALEETFMYEDISGGDMPASIPRSTSSQLPSTMCSLYVLGWLLNLNDLSSCNPVWAHLTTLGIAVRTEKAVPHLLQLAPNLSSLTICIMFVDSEPLMPFTHPNLQTLIIFYKCYDVPLAEPKFCDLLNALSLPTLRVLIVYNVPQWPHEEFKAFLAQLGSPLESLIVRGSVMTDEQQAEYAALVPAFRFVLTPC
ncbi:hypothetical protein F4604DRAFT_1903713 [Suillus subluteus]|nr:hypothetical protein F4604DRAFT_1903713 [Suillus subluteus]